MKVRLGMKEVRNIFHAPRLAINGNSYSVVSAKIAELIPMC
jgi:hypothetical protein